MGRASAFQSTISLAAALMGLGLGSAVIKQGAELANRPSDPSFRLLILAAWSLWRRACIFGGLTVLVFGTTYRLWQHESIAIAANDLFLAWAILASTASTLSQGIISASRRVSLQATYLAFGGLAGHLLSVPLVWHSGPSAIGLAVAINYSGIALVSLLLHRIVVAQHSNPTGSVDLHPSREALLHVGLPLALSNLVGGGVQTALPLLMVYQVGDDGAGLFRAASLLAFQSVGFLLTALSQDFFPRLSSIRKNSDAIIAMLRKQFKLMLLLALGATSSLTALGPWLLRICFSDQFVNATLLLDLLAIGMIFKMGSWCLAYVVLARCSSRLYLFTEGVTGLFWLASSALLMSVYGANGIGYAFALTYLLYFVLVSFIVSSDLQSTLPWNMLLGSILATIPVIGVIGLRTSFGTPL